MYDIYHDRVIINACAGHAFDEEQELEHAAEGEHQRLLRSLESQTNEALAAKARHEKSLGVLSPPPPLFLSLSLHSCVFTLSDRGEHTCARIHTTHIRTELAGNYLEHRQKEHADKLEEEAAALRTTLQAKHDTALRSLQRYQQ